jgi:hypothetical protein
VLNGKPMAPVGGCMSIGPDPAEQGGTMVLPIDVPAGSTITGVEARVLDGTALVGYSIAFQRLAPSITGMSFANLRASAGGAAAGPVVVELTPAIPVIAGFGETFAVELSLEMPGGSSERNALCSVTIEYTLPAP